MLGKSLHLCFSRLKRPSSSTPPSTQNALHVPTAVYSSSSASASASASASSSIVFKNFNSLYGPDASDSEIFTLTGSGSTSQTLTVSSSFDSDNDISTAIASRRLIRASPGRSNSIVADSSAEKIAVEISAVPKYSPDPYGEFRKSMEEMVVALGLDNGGIHHQSGAYMLQELLLCYIALNRKNAHKHIVRAFADLLRELAAGASAGEEN